MHVVLIVVNLTSSRIAIKVREAVCGPAVGGEAEMLQWVLIGAPDLRADSGALAALCNASRAR